MVTLNDSTLWLKRLGHLLRHNEQHHMKVHCSNVKDNNFELSSTHWGPTKFLVKRIRVWGFHIWAEGQSIADVDVNREMTEGLRMNLCDERGCYFLKKLKCCVGCAVKRWKLTFFKRVHFGQITTHNKMAERVDVQSPAAWSMASAKHWLRSMETYTFLWQFTLVSANRASRNSGQIARSSSERILEERLRRNGCQIK